MDENSPYSTEQTQIPMRISIMRHNLVIGCERSLFVLLGTFTACLFFISIEVWYFVFAAIFLWLFGLRVLRYMGNRDPILSVVYIRSLKYQPWYAPVYSPFCKKKQMIRPNYFNNKEFT